MQNRKLIEHIQENLNKIHNLLSIFEEHFKNDTDMPKYRYGALITVCLESLDNASEDLTSIISAEKKEE